MRLLAEIALVLATAVGVAVCVALVPTGPPARRRRAAASQPPTPEQLVRLERLVSMAGATAAQVHAYLRPVLAEIASRRLAGHGQPLDRMPESVGRELPGDCLWEIVRPDRPFPEDRYAPGVSAAELNEMLDMLERL